MKNRIAHLGTQLSKVAELGREKGHPNVPNLILKWFDAQGIYDPDDRLDILEAANERDAFFAMREEGA